MAHKIKVWLKEPMKKARHVWISDSLENLQKTVEGYIENYNLSPEVGVICNEEGRLKDLYYNVTLENQSFYGTIILVGYQGEEFASCPFEISDIKKYYPQLLREE